MLYYSRIEIFEGAGVNNVSASKEYIICHYCFCNKRFRFQQLVYNGCHDILMMSVVIILVISDIYGVDYQCSITKISKIGAINLLKNADLSEKKLAHYKA